MSRRRENAATPIVAYLRIGRSAVKCFVVHGVAGLTIALVNVRRLHGQSTRRFAMRLQLSTLILMRTK